MLIFVRERSQIKGRFVVDMELFYILLFYADTVVPDFGHMRAFSSIIFIALHLFNEVGKRGFLLVCIRKSVVFFASV